MNSVQNCNNKKKSKISNLSTLLTSSNSNFVFWVDAKDNTTLFSNSNGTGSVTTNGSSVKHWKNKAKTGNNATWASTNVTYYTDGSYPYLAFSGSNPSDLNINLSACSIFVVASYYTTTYGNFPGLLGNGAGGGKNYFYGNRSGTGLGGVFNSPTIYICGSTNNANSYMTSLNLLELIGTTTSITNAGIGYGDSGDKWIGNISEFLIFSSTLSESDRQTIEGYLAWKWGFNSRLPTNHTWYSISP